MFGDECVFAWVLLKSYLCSLVSLLFPFLGPNGGIAKAIAELVRPAALAAFQEALASVFTSNAEARRKAKEAALKALDEAYMLLQLYHHGLDIVQVGLGSMPGLARPCA